MAKDSAGSTLVVGNYVKFLPSDLPAFEPLNTTIIGVITQMQSGGVDTVGLDITFLDANGQQAHDYKLSNVVTLVPVP